MEIPRKERLCLIMTATSLLFWGCAMFRREPEPPLPFKTEKLEIVVDEIDPADQEFPGGRGADEMILYTPDFGERTGANQWGAEAIVENGMVRKVGGNNSPIPDDGFVLSGHGKSARWIMQHLSPGVEMEAEGMKLTARITDQTFRVRAKQLIADATNRLESSGPIHPSIPMSDLQELEQSSSEWAEQAHEARENNDPAKALFYSKRALRDALLYFYKSQPSRQKELRACWCRLTEKSPEELEETFQMLARAGFNCICPETIYWGCAIYPGAHDQLEQNPAFKGWDPLETMCRLGKQYHIKVIPWVEVYFIGFEDSPLIKRFGNWLAMSHSGGHASELEEGYYYLCPSRKQVRSFWLEVYKHLLDTYDIDGLQLDYIRYPRSEPWDKGYCYCSHCREKFFNQYEIDPASLHPDKDKKMWQNWNEFRKEQVNIFVNQVSDLVDQVRPDVRLSADVFPDPGDAEESKLQDWPLWLEKKYLDEIFIMSYTTDPEQVRRDTEEMVNLLPEGIEGYTGLGPYLGFGSRILLEQILTARKANAHGVCLFSLEHLNDQHLDALKLGPFREKATMPK